MIRNHKAFPSLALVLAGLVMAGPVRAAGDVNFQPDPLEPGRHPMIPHDHGPEATAELRANIPVFATMPDNVLHMIMNSMRADYAWYISPAQVRGKVPNQQAKLRASCGLSTPAGIPSATSARWSSPVTAGVR